MTGRMWTIFAGVVVVLFGGLLYLSSRNSIDVSGVDILKAQNAAEQSGGIADHVSGPTDAKVTLIEYGDYQCPGCGSAYQPIKTVTDKYKGQLKFIFRNFPLTNLHPNARAAAAAAETAGMMGKYWQMHDILYQNQSSWESASADQRLAIFAGFASQIGLDADSFKQTYTDKASVISKKIDFDAALGKKAGVSGTPTFFLNGKELDQSYKDGKLVPGNTSGAALIWSNADAFDTLIIQPALKQAGVALPTDKK